MPCRKMGWAGERALAGRSWPRVSILFLWLGIPTRLRKLGVSHGELGVTGSGAVEENWFRGLSR